MQYKYEARRWREMYHCFMYSLQVLPKEMNASRDYYTENNGEIGFKTGDPLTIIEAR